METLFDSSFEKKARRLAEKIEKTFWRYKVNMEIVDCYISHYWAIFELKLKGEKREEHLLDRLSDD